MLGNEMAYTPCRSTVFATGPTRTSMTVIEPQSAIPLSGLLIALFTIEQLVNGWRNGFDHPPDPFEEADAGRTAGEQIGGLI